MKRKLLGVLSIATVLTLNAVPAFAETGTQNIPVTYNDIKIVVDGNTVPTSTEPFIYNGTTYLPVRAIGEALGKDVSWDGNTNTVYIGTTTNTDTQPSAPVSQNEVIYDANNIKVTYTGLTQDEWGEITVNLNIENNSGTDYTLQARDTSINGIMIDPAFSCDVLSGKMAVDGMDFQSWNLEDIGISSIAQINEIEFRLHIFETDDLLSYIESDLIKIDF